MNVINYFLLFSLCTMIGNTQVAAETTSTFYPDRDPTQLEDSVYNTLGRNYLAKADVGDKEPASEAEESSKIEDDQPNAEGHNGVRVLKPSSVHVKQPYQINYIPAINDLPYANSDSRFPEDKPIASNAKPVIEEASFEESEYELPSDAFRQGLWTGSTRPVEGYQSESNQADSQQETLPTPIEFQSNTTLNPPPANYYLKSKEVKPTHVHAPKIVVDEQPVKEDAPSEKSNGVKAKMPTANKKRDLLEKVLSERAIKNIEEGPSEKVDDEIAYVNIRRRELPAPCLVQSDISHLNDICVDPLDCESCGLPSFCLYTEYMLGKGVGYSTGYTSLGLTVASLAPADWKFQPFVDVRGHVLNNGQQAANIGFGGYYCCESLKTIFGLNAYYDYRHGRFTNYNQVGIGTEVIGECWDARINGYIPVGRREETRCKLFDEYDGNYFAICQRKERSLGGFDAEIGYMLKQHNPCDSSCCNFDLYGAIGPYYFATQCGPNAFGGQVRLVATWMKYLHLEVIATTDRVYHERVQGRFGIEIPLGGSFWGSDNSCGNCVVSCWPRDCDCLRVQRREIIALEDCCCWETNYDSNCSSSSDSSSSWGSSYGEYRQSSSSDCSSSSSH